MKELKQRILDEALVGEGDIIHVDMFLNHCMDMELIEHVGNELARRFKSAHITKVLTVESSGIAIACFVGRALRVPVIYAKNSRPVTSTPTSTRRRPIPSPWKNPIPSGCPKNTWMRRM